MLIEVDSKTYKRYFPTDPHPFISDPFIDLNSGKAEKVIRLVADNIKPLIGLIAGIKNGVLHSPFSAPFGGFHFHNQIVYINEIDNFITSLKDYIISNRMKGIEITLPPDIYHSTFNAKTINSLIRNGFNFRIPEITGWVNLRNFNGEFSQRNCREYYKQALRNGLSFDLATDNEKKMQVYDVICQNRARFGRPIYMTFNDVINTGNLWPVDFFKVITKDNEIVGSAIFYRFTGDICYPVFWGDTESGRPLRVMDFMASNLWSYYKNQGFKYLDFGTATEAGIPNEGLLRFKESHESISSLRFRFFWNNH